MHSSCIDDILKRSCFSNYLASEATGFAGGIWILWNASVVNIELISMDDQFINVVVDNFLVEQWVLTAVYASPNLAFRNSLWIYLEELGRVMTRPWLLLGDFNQVLRESEKRGGGPLRGNGATRFANKIATCGLLDLGFSRPPFTWDNMRWVRNGWTELCLIKTGSFFSQTPQFGTSHVHGPTMCDYFSPHWWIGTPEKCQDNSGCRQRGLRYHLLLSRWHTHGE